MSDKYETTQQETTAHVTELKTKRSFDWKKYAKVAAYSTAAVLSAVVIFKLASEPEAPKLEIEIEEKTPEVDENVA